MVSSAALRCLARVLLAIAACIGVACAVPNDALRTIVAMGVVLLGVPLTIVCFIDWFESLKSEESDGWMKWWFARLASLPVLALGVTAVMCGLGMIGWIFYLRWTGEIRDTSWSALQPFGIAPLLFGGGMAWVSIGLRSHRSELAAAARLDENSDSIA